MEEFKNQVLKISNGKYSKEQLVSILILSANELNETAIIPISSEVLTGRRSDKFPPFSDISSNKLDTSLIGLIILPTRILILLAVYFFQIKQY